jgi:hypothetical protein
MRAEDIGLRHRRVCAIVDTVWDDCKRHLHSRIAAAAEAKSLHREFRNCPSKSYKLLRQSLYCVSGDLRRDRRSRKAWPPVNAWYAEPMARGCAVWCLMSAKKVRW